MELESRDMFKCSEVGRAAFAKVLRHVREQAGSAYPRDEGGYTPEEANYTRFLKLAQTKGILKYPIAEFGMEFSQSMIEKYSSVSFQAIPNAGLFFLIESWPLPGGQHFTFEGTGEPITFRKLFEVLQELREPTGELKKLPKPNEDS